MTRRAGAATRRGVEGFTLVELLVVLAIAALLLSVVPPMLSAAMPGVELKSAARRIMSSLSLARETAIRSGSDVALVVDVEQRRLELEGFRTVSLPKRLGLDLHAASREMLDETRGAIRFFPDGSSTGGRVTISSGEGADRYGYQVGVTWLTGRVRMAAWSPQ